jgi:hypothetical protein
MRSLYFEGRRRIAQGALDYHEGKGHLEYAIFERWENIFSSTARCGATETYAISRILGVAREQKETVQAAIMGSIGVDALAKLESKISAETSLTIKWNIEEKKEHDFSFPAPKCGVYNAIRYQLIRDYELGYTESRWWRTRRWSASFSERIENFFDGSYTEENDPSCGCSTATWPKLDGLMEALSDKLGFAFPFAWSESVVHLFLPGARVTVMPSNVQTFAIRLPTSTIAPDMLFLAGEAHETLQVSVTLLDVNEGADIRPLSNQERRHFVEQSQDQQLTPILSIAPDSSVGAKVLAPEYATA